MSHPVFIIQGGFAKDINDQIANAQEWFDFNDPVADKKLRDDLLSLALKQDGGYRLATELPKRFSPNEIINPGNGTPQHAWELIGLFLSALHRPFEAIEVFESLYHHMIKSEIAQGNRTHKGMPLCWICESFFNLQHLVHAKRYLMYTLCEDAAGYGPQLRVDGSGVYFRARRQGMSDRMIAEYTRAAHEKILELGRDGWFPERVLTELGDRWMAESPTEGEYSRYVPNALYVQHLLSRLGTDKGTSLEQLAEYLVSMIPGSRVYRRRLSHSTDYDVVGSFEGPGLDFRSELGRYFVCECKDWDRSPADVTVLAKLAYVLDSVNSRFGILFSKNSISGDQERRYAAWEQLKVYAHRGISIVVVSKEDLDRVAAGESFLTMLRSKYEALRLDLM
jgi:hypothetical protein